MHVWLTSAGDGCIYAHARTVRTIVSMVVCSLIVLRKKKVVDAAPLSVLL
jgi:hypothetical protein